MNIERLKEAGRNLEFISSVNPNWSHGRNCGLSDDETESLADQAFNIVNRGIHELIDFYASRQSVKSEEVQKAISWAQVMEIYYEEKQMPECAGCAKVAITALQAYQPAAIPKTETTSCEWCESGIDSASVMSADMMMRFVRPVSFCPNCGRRLEEKRHET